MNIYKKCLLLLFALLILFIVDNATSQVKLLWTSPPSTGTVSLYSVPPNSISYLYVLDTSAHQCKLYNADNYSLSYTITGLRPNDFIYCILKDMNGNGSPKLFIWNSTSGDRIIDASTSSVIYSWPANYQFAGIFITPSSDTVKIAFSNSSDNSLLVYSLGITVTTSVAQQSSSSILPSQVTLQQNFPNPFNPSTTIEYSMPNADNVSIEIYDITGKLVKTLISQRQAAGEHSIVWDGSNNAGSTVSSGTYFYLLKYNNSQDVRKMILLK